MTSFRLQFDIVEIAALAERYDYEDDSGVRELGRRARARGWYTRPEFIEICEWKTVRVRSRAAANSDRAVEEATRRALAARNSTAAIEALRTLHGVDWAVASVFLHFGHADPFPILDFRALEALGVARRTASARLWDDYVDFTRSLARRAGVDMRTLDRALWQWSNERSRTRSPSRRPETSKPAGARQATPVTLRPQVSADVVILGCVSSKARGPARAKDLYVSPLWHKRRAYAEATGRPWVIFSAKHGILDPDELVEWYDVALAKLPAAIRQQKGREAVAQLDRRFGPLKGKAFEVHAGSAYAGALEGPLAARGAELINPVEGLSIGYQLQWYGRKRGT